MTVLDIGAAFGYFLDAAKEKNFKTFGVEISSYACKKASLSHKMLNKNFLEISKETLLNLNDRKAFDLITMWYVFEHFNAPQTVLEKIAAITTRGSLLGLSVPNGKGFSAKFIKSDFLKTSPHDHFYIYNIPFLKKLLKRYGFKLIKARSTGIHFTRVKKRFPVLSRLISSEIYKKIASFFMLGDTIEVCFQKK